jgi:transcriptional regulator with XRE-family HTH domain
VNKKRVPGQVDPDAQALGSRIDQLADLLGGKKELARLANVSEVQIYRYINGENVPNVNVIVKLARAAGVSIEWLATGEGPGMLAGIHETKPAYGPGPGQAPPSTEIDRALLVHVVAALEGYLEREAFRLPTRDRADIIAEIYADVVSAMPDPESRRAMADSVMSSIVRFLRGRGGASE